MQIAAGLPVAVAVVPEAVKTGIAEAGTKKDETFAVKEITEPVRTDPVTGNAAVPPAAAPKEDSSTLAEVNTPEPFVVKEVVTKRDNAGPPPHTAVNNTATHTEEVKYLPFVIKPGGKADSNNETAQSPEAVTEKKAEAAPAATPEKNTGLWVEKNEGQKAVLSAVKKTLERKSREGIDLIYIDENINGTKDTIRIFIPALK
ncbi:MAG TPA: hypothetical protein PLL71_15545 [Agriterribacter sp.]|nr:hypothetical protein [Agriterribacter sp.]